ncbi:MAG: carboxypeptidase regulatory-like domain-containing protein, partial [Acidobacteriota bacterium]|nr:carboxypeptidase regulatory-like domain-containing protein [Acidobacteriota bacterium]
MNNLMRGLILAALFGLLAATPMRGQTSSAPKGTPGSITGRVTGGGDKALPGVPVVLFSSEPATRFKVLARAKTDAEGRFTLTNIAAGRYSVMPVAPDKVVTNSNEWSPGKPVTLAAGEHAEGFDFQITKGGVITGRITDPDGIPVIGESVHLEPLDNNNNQPRNLVYNSRPGMETDDRGIYRIYGLAGGRYRVGAGDDPTGERFRMGGRRGFHMRVYYPNVSDKAEAKIIDVAEGSEATEIDITLGPLAQTYKVSGRVVSAESGQPVAGVILSYGKIAKDGQRLGSYGSGIGMGANARGEFTIDNVLPGRYGTFVSTRDGNDGLYSDTAIFEVADRDVTGIEVKVHTGMTISGSVVVEGTSDRNLVARLMPQILIFAHTEESGQAVAPNSSATKVSVDGSFRLTGVRPGKVQVGMGSWPPVKGLTQVRVEHNGVEQKDGIDVTAGEQVAGVRVVVAYGTGIVRGQINIVGGVLPEGGRMIVHVRRQDSDSSRSGQSAEVDARGRFLIEGMPAGEYELMLRSWSRGPRERSLPQVKQSVTVSDGTESNVT